MPLPAAFLFDMDGLLLDTERMFMQSFVDLCGGIGIGPDVAEAFFVTLVGTSSKVTSQRLREFLPKSVKPAAFEARWRALHAENVAVGVPLKDHVLDVLGVLRENHARLAVVTSTHGDPARHHLKHAGIFEYFEQVKKLLKPDGVALIHTIGRCAPPNVTSSWITKYIFPGGYCPAMSEVLPKIEDANLITTDIEVWRIHYADTLRDWRARFEANMDKVLEIYDYTFCRMWRYYLIASELTFRLDRQVVFQFQITKDQQAVPVTRDYLY